MTYISIFLKKHVDLREINIKFWGIQVLTTKLEGKRLTERG